MYLLKKYSAFFLLSIFFLLGILPLFHHGFFMTDDGEWMIIRFSAFHQALSGGQFPVRFLSRLNYEYGYPVANFLYPGFMYLSEIFHLAKFGFVDSVKIVSGLSFVVPGIFVYLWLSKKFASMPAFFAALFFVFNPYHLFDLYRRGSVGEILAIGLVPVIFYYLDSGKLFLYSLLLALLVTSHNILALLFLPLIFIYRILHRPAKEEILRFLLYTFLGLGMSAFFWLPAIADLSTTVFSRTEISLWRNYFSTLPLIGIANIILFVGSLIVLSIHKKDSSKKSEYILPLFFIIVSFFALFFSLPISTFIWNFLPVSIIQFPFRVLSLTVIGFPFLIAFFLNFFRKRHQIIFGIFFTLILIFFSSEFILHNEYFDKGDGYYATNEATTTVKNEYMPKWVRELPVSKPSSRVVSEKAVISGLQEKSTTVSFTAQAKEKTSIFINFIYFPGFNAWIDGKKTVIHYDNPKGIINLYLPPGIHRIKVLFDETPLRLAADMLSVQCFIVASFLSAWKKLKIKEKYGNY